MQIVQNKWPQCEPALSVTSIIERQELLEYIARCAYMIDQHRAGIALNSARIAAAQESLARLECADDAGIAA